MKTFTFLILLLPFAINAQKKDLTQSEALKNFKINVKQSPLQNNFEIIWKQAKCIKKNYKIPFSEMPIFANDNINNDDTNYYIDMYYFGLGETRLPKYDNNGKKIITCNAFETL